MKRVKSDYFPRSITFTQKEHGILFPNETKRRIDILFPRLSGIADLRDEIAEYIVKKHDNVHLYEEPKPAVVEPEITEPEVELVMVNPVTEELQVAPKPRRKSAEVGDILKEAGNTK